MSTVSNRRKPGYKLHKPSGQARCIIGGKHFYLGPYGSPASWQKYDRLIAEHFADPASGIEKQPSKIIVAELAAALWASLRDVRAGSIPGRGGETPGASRPPPQP